MQNEWSGTLVASAFLASIAGNKMVERL